MIFSYFLKIIEGKLFDNLRAQNNWLEASSANIIISIIFNYITIR